MSTLPAPALMVRELSVSRGDRWVLDGLSATIPTGATTVVVGANGSGKSTLLEVLVGLRSAAAGSVTHHAPPRPRGGLDVAFVPQHTPESATFPLTVRDVVSMGRWARRGPWRPLRAADRELVDRWVDRLDLTDLARRRLDTLSGGQRQRALVARALAQDAPVLVLDEPTTGLDADSRSKLLEALESAAREGAAVVASTHDEHLVRVADQVLELRDGRAVRASEPRSTAARQRWGPAPTCAF